jgi:Fe-S-cluster containining protein
MYLVMDTPAAADQLLLRVVDSALADAARLAGDRLACRPGCNVCCIGPFPITQLDAQRLRRGLAEIAPATATRIRQRARRAVETLTPGFPGDAPSGILTDDEDEEWRFCDLHKDLPCPALDPDSGTCDLYEWRPIACRTYGPPVRLEGEDLPPCPLCFQGALAAEVDRCRVTVDPDGVQDAVLAASDAPDGRTLIAFALGGD